MTVSEFGVTRGTRAIIAISFFVLLAAGCKSNPKPPPAQNDELIYREIEHQFISGDLLDAQQRAENAFRESRSIPDWNARFRIELAKVYLYQGETERATSLLSQQLPKCVEPDLIIQRDILLGMAEARLGQRELSREAIDRVEALHPNEVLRAELEGSEGSIALEQGRLAQAEGLFESALSKAQQHQEKFIETQMWMNLGVVALQLEHYEDAQDRFAHASLVAESIGARLALEKAEGNLGWTYNKTGDLARALQSSKKAEVRAASIGATLDEVQWIKNAGMSQFDMGDLVGARSSYERSLKLAESLHSSEEILSAHVALAFLLLDVDAQMAESHIREASLIARLRQNSTEEVEPLLLQSLWLRQHGNLQEAEKGLLDLVQRVEIPPSVKWVSENTLGTLYARTGQRKEAERWFRRAIDTFHRQRLSVKSIELQLPFLENGNDLYMGYMEFLIRQHRTDDALNILDESRAETLAEGLGAATGGGGVSAKLAAVRTLAARLHGTILVYCLQPEASHLWAINATRQEFYTLPGSATILPLVERHTQAILASKDLLAQRDSTGRALYDALVRPAEGQIGHGGRVFVIADKGMTGLNFETLVPPGEQAHYWIEDATVTNARSLRLLGGVKERAGPGGTQRVLLMGDPVYRPEEYALLPNAAAEMKGVASHFAVERRAVFAGAQASPVSYAASGPGQFAYIHFVAHATANEANPLDSAIILSSPDGKAAAYKLFARDILRQPLDTELVTISSCYGTGVRNYSGEGVVGLVWAFLRAGSHSVIGAMWEVSDVSTPQLMDALYTQLLAGSRPDAALRSAKLAMLHGDGVFRKPLYWASFQLYSGR